MVQCVSWSLWVSVQGIESEEYREKRKNEEENVRKGGKDNKEKKKWERKKRLPVTSQNQGFFQQMCAYKFAHVQTLQIASSNYFYLQ